MTEQGRIEIEWQQLPNEVRKLKAVRAIGPDGARVSLPVTDLRITLDGSFLSQATMSLFRWTDVTDESLV